MTAPAIAAPSCPKCSGPMWDQKNGKFAWKPGTPIFKCKTKECASNGGVYWESKAGSAPSTGVRPAPQSVPVPSHSNVPNKDLPPLLQNAEAEDNAELAAKVGVDLTKVSKELAVYQGLTEWYVKTIVPILTQGKDPVGCSPDSIARSVNTLFINVAGK